MRVKRGEYSAAPECKSLVGGALQFSTSVRKKPQLIYNGFVYNCVYALSSGVRWECIDRKKHRCRACVTTKENQMVKTHAMHFHEPHTELIHKKNVTHSLTGHSWMPGEHSVGDVAHYSAAFSGIVARALASHHGDPGSIPGGFTPGFLHVGIMLDNATCQWVFSRYSPALTFHHRSDLGLEHVVLLFPGRMLEYVRSRQGRPLLVYDDHLFSEERAHGSRVFWKCTKWLIAKCRARIVTVGNTMIVKCGVHTHESQAQLIQQKRMKEFFTYQQKLMF
ncbi:hypothetical protein PR048_022860 [Dryococelus australis]|uniref:FLYWCH-type domain-containing protein n=1 Tax=Dryococelus australis TaxID=614101 RepID=A0ABQ9GSG8_9NEOP|nr:hypothetical protein PR048_022860 [Dryococelus australis]